MEAKPTVPQPEKRSADEITGEDDNAAKKVKTVDARDPQHGVAPVKAEFLIVRKPVAPVVDDDAAEASHHAEGDNADSRGKKNRGQNKARKFHFSNEEHKLCQSYTHIPRESLFATAICDYAVNAAEKGPSNRGANGRHKKGGRRDRNAEATDFEAEQTEAKVEEPEVKAEQTEAAPEEKARPLCAFEHNLREYLARKPADIEGVCPAFQERGMCASGWKCKWLGSHMKEENGEIFLVIDEEKVKSYEEKASNDMDEKLKNSKTEIGSSDVLDWEKEMPDRGFEDPYGEIVNNVPVAIKIKIRKNQVPLKRSDVFLDWNRKIRDQPDQEDHRAGYVEPPPKPSEKRRLYIGKETPLLAPLTTTGNMPFRRLCIGLGAGITWSEMAMTSSILNGHKPEWALLRAHRSELPHFGVQMAANKIDQAVRATEAITNLFPTAASGRHGLAAIDLNCGCPIDLIYKSGGGSALLDQQGKLIKMLKGMNYVSGETPITVKIRMGTRDNHPTAQKLINKLIDHGDVQAVTLHGRSRQQRYSRSADWEYIHQTAALIKNIKAQNALQVDTAADKEGREKLNTFFVGNGDCYSHVDYHNAVEKGGVDSVMVARGALIKPWIFEEIQKGQYIDKSATERLDLVRDYVKYGLECWGSDELGVATTRRFLLEWLSFTCRYVPIGILERLPPKINDRPPSWRGRSDLETLLGSHDYRDWIKISEMFLGPCPQDFFFTPKHKSSSAPDGEAEG
ncbi:hypothetical protein FPQ18DRAFT_292412 [Pyronema domesticum]|uniref:tRNA-dihydrouridine(47) synthase [NAD(P)(+)] n=1 Tax=Pyronema omphalodes (strain CBS 100304) TaxID=1076935 RepID=U4L5A4_PYROM|nr:hypothetical protein FPQ18DRAFT_292412 [Pyronema domesticum]CCX11323.1 Similar to tRNA-dihydrouridine(47) synthase [NAD(P)(+)]; acc. no. Q5BF62 [Pyronema omphalodes CBS 100304]